MNVKIGTEAAQFPEKEYINGIFLAVCAVLFTLRAKLVLVYESNCHVGHPICTAQLGLLVFLL
jgi:hypothetical protein